jgi:hypothetical protein
VYDALVAPDEIFGGSTYSEVVVAAVSEIAHHK